MTPEQLALQDKRDALREIEEQTQASARVRDLNRRLARGHALPRVLKGLGIVSIVGGIVLGVPLTLFGLTVAGSVGAHVVFGLLFAGIPVGLGL
jgi:hypothetical protein